MLDNSKYSPPRAYRPTRRDLPQESLFFFLLSLPAACLIGAVYFYASYADNAHPHNPIWGLWATWPEGLQRTGQHVLTAVLGIIPGIATIVQGRRLRNVWNQTGRALAVLWYFDQQDSYLDRRAYIVEHMESQDRSRRQSFAQMQMDLENLAPPSKWGWRIWDERAKVLCDLKRYTEAMDSQIFAREAEIEVLQLQGASKKDISIAKCRHDESIALIRSLMEDDT